MKPGVYRHYKGGIYYVLTTALAVETGKVVVVYSALYPIEGPEKTFTRNLNGPDGFITPVVLGDGAVVPRFEFLGDIMPPELHPPPAESRV